MLFLTFQFGMEVSPGKGTYKGEPDTTTNIGGEIASLRLM